MSDGMGSSEWISDQPRFPEALVEAVAKAWHTDRILEPPPWDNAGEAEQESWRQSVRVVLRYLVEYMTSVGATHMAARDLSLIRAEGAVPHGDEYWSGRHYRLVPVNLPAPNPEPCPRCGGLELLYEDMIGKPGSTCLGPCPDCGGTR